MRSFHPSPLTVLMLVIALAALCTWLIPAGKFDTLQYEADKGFVIHQAESSRTLPATQSSLDSLGIRIQLEKFLDGSIRKPVSVPGTYHRLGASRQSITDILAAPVKGIYDTIDIILFLLFIGGFIEVFNRSGAMEAGLLRLSRNMKGKEAWLLILLGFLFSFAGASYGMAEEGLAFYPILIPLFLAAGYDLLVPVAVIFGGTQLGTLASFTNPFSTIIASNAAGISWTNGFSSRLIIFLLTTAIYIWWLVRYAQKVKRDPAASLVLKFDGVVEPPYAATPENAGPAALTTKRSNLLLLVFLASFLVMIGGVVLLDWWLTEMTIVFLVAVVVVAILMRLPEKEFVQAFLEGARGLLGVAFIVGFARGVSIMLDQGQIADTIIHFTANLVSGMPRPAFLVLLFLFYMVFTLFIASTSGMAVVTMPIMGSLAVFTGVQGYSIVNAYLFGMGIMGFLSPTGLILPSLASARISFTTWFRFLLPVLAMLTAICLLCLLLL